MHGWQRNKNVGEFILMLARQCTRLGPGHWPKFRLGWKELNNAGSSQAQIQTPRLGEDDRKVFFFLI